jgi:hypothetical protein
MEMTTSQIYNQRWYYKDLSKTRKIRKENSRKFRKLHPELEKKNKKKYYFKKTYNITIEQYENMVKEQNGLCAICGNLPHNGQWKKLVVDHNHQTGQVRKLLCDNCNRYLGFIKEDINLLDKIKLYLQKNGAGSVTRSSAETLPN